MSTKIGRTDPLRPTTLAEFGGQPAITDVLGVMVSAARERSEMVDHLLFAGPPGLGKTTLAGIVARELGVPLVTTSGPALERPGDLASILSGLGKESVVFIDEIHRLPKQIEEILYQAMEDGELDFMVNPGSTSARSIRLPLQPFTLIGATTLSGKLSGPLRDRFGYIARLGLYGEDDLVKIVLRSAELLDVDVDPDGAKVVALRSRGTPRVANALLRRVRDWAQLHSPGTITAEVAAKALNFYQIDTIGLDTLGVTILRVICERFGGGPVGLTTLAHNVGADETTVEQQYEPFLMAQGLLTRTPRGRVTTAAAYEHLGLPVPPAIAIAGGGEPTATGTLFDAS